MDKLNDFILRPKFLCNYPCKNCDPLTPDVCLDCWDGVDNPNFLMFYPDDKSTCTYTCELGFTSNGNPEKHCEKCDESCKTCRDNAAVGDKKLCIDCADDHRFRISQTDTCLRECKLGMYQSTANSCAYCRSPCNTCEETESKCTSCKLTEE